MAFDAVSQSELVADAVEIVPRPLDLEISVALQEIGEESETYLERDQLPGESEMVPFHWVQESAG